ncbi:hypothetical protein AB0M47_18805 [Hamadaea sp. NPDC051192]|uniref:hypothetical protein n=1 Tax=Hamadaea sp. NPDC051192 TaxID=3154940 RepID=UPI00342C85F6
MPELGEAALSEIGQNAERWYAGHAARPREQINGADDLAQVRSCLDHRRFDNDNDIDDGDKSVTAADIHGIRVQNGSSASMGLVQVTASVVDRQDGSAAEGSAGPYLGWVGFLSGCGVLGFPEREV